MSDLISRQDAIRLAEQGQIQGFEWQFKKLCALPSAESEIIRCKDCKHYRSYAGIIDGYCDMAEWFGRFQYPNDFCSRAKRRTDE